MSNNAQGQSSSMPNSKKMGAGQTGSGKNATPGNGNLKDVDQNTNPTKATDKVSSQRPGSSQGNVSNKG